MAGPDVQVERHALLRSMAVTGVLGVLGIGWGYLTGSQMILLDGVYALVGIVVSWMLLHASGLAQAEPSPRYPFGREAVTPLVIGVQGFVLLATLLYAAVGAVNAILDGGTTVAPGLAVAYGVVTTLGSVIVWRWLRPRSGGSDLLTSETTAWRVSSMRGLGMILGFTLVVALTGSSWDAAAPYVDPVMVLVTCVAFLADPIRMVRTTFVELLEGAPSGHLQAEVSAILADALAPFDLESPDVLMSKVGPKLYVEVDAVVAPDMTVRQEQRVRDALRASLDHLPYDLWLNVEFAPRDGGEPIAEGSPAAPQGA